jgi:hypothetical protein
MADFPWGTIKWKEQLAPVMAFAGPITFLVFALLSIFTTLILFANSLGVTVSAAHRIAGNIFAVAVLCGDPLIQAGITPTLDQTNNMGLRARCLLIHVKASLSASMVIDACQVSRPFATFPPLSL